MYFTSSATPLLLASSFAIPENFNRQVTQQTNFIYPQGNSVVPPGNSVSQSSIRRRIQLGNPNEDVDVIALSPNEIKNTKRFTCEKCYQSFARKQNLLLHGRIHGLPWKLQKNQKTKRKVYICPEPTCVHNDPARALAGMTAIKKHYFRKHGVKRYKCHKCFLKVYAVRSDRDAHSKTCGTKKYTPTSSSRNPTMSLTEMTTPSSGGGRPIFSSGVAAEDFSQSSPNLGLMAHNDHNIMNFHENDIPSIFTNGVNEFGDGDNGNLLGLMNSFDPIIDHQSQSRNIFDPHFGNNLNIGGSDRMMDGFRGGIMSTVNDQGGHGGYGGSGGYRNLGVQGIQGGFGGVQGGYGGYGFQGGQSGYGGYGGQSGYGVQGGYGHLDVQGDHGVQGGHVGYGDLDIQGDYGVQGGHGVQSIQSGYGDYGIQGSLSGHGNQDGHGDLDVQGDYGVQGGHDVQGIQCGYGNFGVQGSLSGHGNQDGHGEDPMDFGLWDELWTHKYLDEAEMINVVGAI